jgi:hypothetical protein
MKGWGDEISACEGKVAFDKQSTAVVSSKRRKGRVVYRCPHCHGWHVGTKEPRIKRFVKRKKLIRLFLQTEWIG